MKNFIKEFKEFMARGNVIDLAVAVVIGGAFTAIVNSLVNDIIMPILGIILGGINFGNLMLTVGSAEIRYGMFIQAVINLLLIGLVIFSLIKAMNRFKKKEEVKEEPAAPAEDIKLLTEIRDLLRNK
ncbi:large-conductance mechanosensitive channel protein MscL [Eubacteriales bacterium KG127]